MVAPPWILKRRETFLSSFLFYSHTRKLFVRLSRGRSIGNYDGNDKISKNTARPQEEDQFFCDAK